MKQTAVEYIKEKLLGDEYWYENMTFEQIFDQAKAMEKEQIIEAFDKGLITENVYYGYDNKKADEYYNETFKSE